MAISPTAVPHGKDATAIADMYVRLELADKSWTLAIK
jgi:hypothetical protein